MPNFPFQEHLGKIWGPKSGSKNCWKWKKSTFCENQWLWSGIVKKKQEQRLVLLFGRSGYNSYKNITILSIIGPNMGVKMSAKIHWKMLFKLFSGYTFWKEIRYISIINGLSYLPIKYCYDSRRKITSLSSILPPEKWVNFSKSNQIRSFWGKTRPFLLWKPQVIYYQI